MTRSDGDKFLKLADEALERMDCDKAIEHGEKAFEYFKEAVERNSDDKHAWHKLADIYRSYPVEDAPLVELFKKRIECLLNALEEENVSILKELATAYLNLHGEDEKEEYSKRAEACLIVYLIQNDGDASAWVDLGDVYKMHEGVRVYALDSVSKHLPIKKSYRKNKVIKGVEIKGIQFEK